MLDRDWVDWPRGNDAIEGGRPPPPRMTLGAEEFGRPYVREEANGEFAGWECSVTTPPLVSRVLDVLVGSNGSWSSDTPPPPCTLQTRATRSAHSRVLTSRSAPRFSTSKGSFNFKIRTAGNTPAGRYKGAWVATRIREENRC